ncbi:hypothetical protein D5F01_LYC18095 [Larimichthys crocea]|uniref:Uncharacterized protein n=1 Tax=Larimichthys crocea TaxID=215358 RepID=A0A6G0HUQ4_LARCR|nr:hypothetical protein D5F01_LYC18095 [Larimichthys crocea]
MAIPWLLVVMAAAVFVSMVLLVAVCLNCRDKGPLVSIRQTNASEEPSGFRVIHPTQPINDRNSIHPAAHLLSPFSDAGTQRHSTYTATETDSNPSYENPVVVESDNDDPGYIIVLPEGATPVTNQSRASTPSSDVLHDYENVPEKKTDSRGEYLNVENFHSEAWSPSLSRPLFGCESSAQSKSSDDDDDDDDDGDSDSEGNYVNVNEAPL